MGCVELRARGQHGRRSWYAQTFESVVNGVSTTREYIYHAPEGMAEMPLWCLCCTATSARLKGCTTSVGSANLQTKKVRRGVATRLARRQRKQPLERQFDWGSVAHVSYPACPTPPSRTQPCCRLHLQLRVLQRGIHELQFGVPCGRHLPGIGSVGGTMTNNVGKLHAGGAGAGRSHSRHTG